MMVLIVVVSYSGKVVDLLVSDILDVECLFSNVPELQSQTNLLELLSSGPATNSGAWIFIDGLTRYRLCSSVNMAISSLFFVVISLV